MDGVASPSGSIALENALASLPHGEQFRFVTRITALEPATSAQGIWHIHGNESFFAGHFPGNPIVPGVLIGEALAQLSGIVCGHAALPIVANQGRLAQIDLRFLRAVIPPAMIELKSELSRSLEALHLFAVEALVNGKTVASGRLTLAFEPESGALKIALLLLAVLVERSWNQNAANISVESNGDDQRAEPRDLSARPGWD